MYYVKFWLLFIFLNNTLIFGFGYDKIEEQETLGKILREEVHIMGGKFGVFLESLLSGEFDFSALGQFFANINHSIMANSDLMGQMEKDLSTSKSSKTRSMSLNLRISDIRYTKWTLTKPCNL